MRVAFYLSLSFDVIIHVHQVADCFCIIRNVSIAMNGVLDHAAGNGKIDHIHRIVVIHHGID